MKFLLNGKRVHRIPIAGSARFERASILLKTSTGYKLYLFVFLFLIILNYNTGITQIVNQQWVVRYDSSGISKSEGTDITTNSSGDIYVTGNIINSNNSDILTIKYSASGQEIWSRTYNSPGSRSDFGIMVEVDINQDIIVCGNESLNGVLVVIKYNSFGDTLWTQRYQRSPAISNTPIRMKTDIDGSIFLTLTTTLGGYDDYTILKYSSNGILKWQVHFTNILFSSDQANALALGDDNYFYTAGFSTDTLLTGIIIKFDKTTGDSIWSNRISNFIPEDISVSKTGMVFSTGNKEGQYFTCKLNPAGELLWNRIYNDIGGNSLKIGVDSNYNCYVAGYKFSNSPGITILKYNTTGEFLWTRTILGSTASSCILSDLIVEKNGDFYIGGSNTIELPFSDYLTIKYNINGDFIWMKRYNYYRTHSDHLYSLTKDNTGNIIVTGISYKNLQYSCTTIKYSQTLGVNLISNQIPASSYLEQNYPNPFNPSTRIRYSIKENANVIIKIYDQLGKELSTLLDQYQNSGVYEVDFHGDNLASGIYFYKIDTGNYRDTKKMILLK